MNKKTVIVTIETFDEITCEQIKKIIEFGLPFHTKDDVLGVKKTKIKVKEYNPTEEDEPYYRDWES